MSLHCARMWAIWLLAFLVGLTFSLPHTNMTDPRLKDGFHIDCLSAISRFPNDTPAEEKGALFTKDNLDWIYRLPRVAVHETCKAEVSLFRVVSEFSSWQEIKDAFTRMNEYMFLHNLNQRLAFTGETNKIAILLKLREQDSAFESS